ncbi:MAG: hypothetical protein IK130_09580 [Oscillospiraceae bacterium]|nr:hypothetical protein [Oscillospiraceae bacterium]
MNHSKFSRLLAAVTSLTMLGGMLPAYQPGSILTARAEEIAGIEESGESEGGEAPVNPDSPGIEELRAVRSSSIRFDLNGGSLNDEKYAVENGTAVLADETVSADAPEPEAPELSDLVFAGWTDAAGNLTTTFENDTTYYASWNYDSYESANPHSGLITHFNHGSYYDFRGNNGELKTTYSNNGYNITCKLGSNSYSINRNGLKATYIINSGLAVTPVFSFCNCYGTISENPEENLYVKVSYLIQNRSGADVDSFGIASTADVQIGSNDCAPIFAFSDDDTQLNAENCANYNVKNVEMRDNNGNIFLLSIPEDASCWWGHYGSRGSNAFSAHTASNYNVGYDSGIAYSWNGLSIPAGETVEKSVIFAVGDIHLFKTHAFNADGICYGGSGCPLSADHTDEIPLFFQKPQSFEENGSTRYEVRNAGQLMWLSQNINSGEIEDNVNIDLVNDIRFNMNLTQQDDGTYTLSDTLAWVPIAQFSGKFDGKSHTISGLCYEGTEAGGLFGSLSGATVKNVGIENSRFASSAAVGSIAGSANQTTLQNVFSTAEVSGDQAGGLVNSIDLVTISSAYFAGSGTERICSRNSGSWDFTNVYILSDAAGENAATAADFASGKIAYELGRAWSQDLENG